MSKRHNDQVAEEMTLKRRKTTIGTRSSIIRRSTGSHVFTVETRPFHLKDAIALDRPCQCLRTDLYSSLFKKSKVLS